MEIVLTVVFAAIFFYILYVVIRAGTRDGIIAARKAEQDDPIPVRDASEDY
ncbi:hypothetical protein ACFUCV_04450 [Specibacter sp. NPDC057265]|uniref:hypothetical protein n=1 Tax=Specibacter sp. NPDC057265 TaxID=3346075 RepID=UPI00362E47A0